MLSVAADVLPETLQVVLLVFLMMTLVDAVNAVSHGRAGAFLRGGGVWRQYVVASLLATVPGCAGAFSVVSLYTHGMVSFGALAGAMIAASGDEAFVMLALFPDTAVLLFALLALAGILLGRVTDVAVRRLGISIPGGCPAVIVHKGTAGWRHHLREHIWGHIVRTHLWRTALWSYGTLFLTELGMRHLGLSTLAAEYPLALLVSAGVLGLIPQSGPHLVVITMFARGLAPFSVLLVSSIVQDGHGMLPLLAHSVRTSITLKAFNLLFGLTAGLMAYAAGL
ncbi:MAG: putative manganese transporter [Bacteroidota bacterium]